MKLRAVALLPLVHRNTVVGMTYGAHHEPGNMPASVPGNPTASAREDRLRPKGRLRQRPADDSTEEDWSQAMETKLPQRLSRQKRNGPDKTVRSAEQE
jgi:hypothetical protein